MLRGASHLNSFRLIGAADSADDQPVEIAAHESEVDEPFKHSESELSALQSSVGGEDDDVSVSSSEGSLAMFHLILM